MKPVIYIGILWLLPRFSIAQTFYLKGEVKDEAGRALQNVTILQYSTGHVYHTGVAGYFGISARCVTDTLIFSMDGYQKQKIAAGADEFVKVILKKLPALNNARGYKLASFTQNLRRETQRQWFIGDETYASLVENQFIPSHKYPSTGISLNIDRASYSNIRRFLNMKTTVPPDAVRIEEMLNYFNLAYEEPKNGKVFSIRSYLTGCPWNSKNQLLFAAIRSKKAVLDSLPPSHLVFLIDVSGSMDMPNRLPLLKAGFRNLVYNLREMDSVSIVVYGGTVGIGLNTTSGREKDKIFKVIDSLRTGGSTPGESGIKLAYSVARNHFIKNGNNRVILATDGDFNVGLRSEAELEELITKQKEEGVYLTCLGVGMGNYKDSKIQTLAKKGSGNFAYIDSYAEAEKVLLKEFTQTIYTVADDVYLNVQFDPAYVKEYRLIGFDNKVGAIKDTGLGMEGGEIGSGYSMLVAFEIMPSARKEGKENKTARPVTYQLTYQLPGDTARHVIKERPFLSLATLDKADPFFRFAAAVIMFGGLLRESKFMKHVSWNDVASLAKKSVDKTNLPQQEFIAMVHGAKTIYSRKKKKTSH